MGNRPTTTTTTTTTHTQSRSLPTSTNATGERLVPPVQVEDARYKTLRDEVKKGRREGKLDVAQAALERLVVEDANNSDATKLELAHVLRIQWMLKHDFSLLAKAEDMLVTLSQEQQAIYEKNPTDEKTRLMLADVKSALCLVQGSYGRHQDARALAETALTLYWQTPLPTDSERWVLQPNGQWINAVGAAPSVTSQPEPSFRNVMTPVSPAAPSPPATSTTNTSPTTTPSIQPRIWRLMLTTSSQTLMNTPSQKRSKTTQQRIEDNPPSTSINLSNEQMTFILGLGSGASSKLMKQKMQQQSCTFISLGPSRVPKYTNIISPEHAILEYSPSDALWVIEDIRKSHGILVNGVRVRRALLRAGDEVQFGGCDHVKLGDCVTSRSSDALLPPTGLKFIMERVVDFADVSNSTVQGVHFPSAAVAAGSGGGSPRKDNATTFYSSPSTMLGGSGSGSDEKAFQHFHLLAVSSQLALGLPKLDMDEIVSLFGTVTTERVPFHFWQPWLSCELARRKFRD